MSKIDIGKTIKQFAILMSLCFGVANPGFSNTPQTHDVPAFHNDDVIGVTPGLYVYEGQGRRHYYRCSDNGCGKIDRMFNFSKERCAAPFYLTGIRKFINDLPAIGRS